MTGLSYLVHWEGSAPNRLHEEKSLLPDNDESEEEDKGYDGDDVNDMKLMTMATMNDDIAIIVIVTVT